MPDDRAACGRARAWLSAYRDAETGHDDGAVEHLEGCRACSRWGTALDEVTRRARLRAGSAPDVLAPALAAWQAAPPAAVPARPGTADLQERLARVVLAVAGVTGVVLAGLGLLDVFGYVDRAGVHLGWELYSFEAALAVGFLLAARSPARYTAGLLPVTAAVALLTLVPSAGFVAGGGDLLREASHLPVLAGLAGLVLLADVQGRRRARGRRDSRRPAIA